MANNLIVGGWRVPAQPDRRQVVAGVAALGIAGPGRAGQADEIAGRWAGVAELPNDRMEFSVAFARDPSGALAATADILDAGVLRLPLRDVAATGGDVRFTMPFPGGGVPFVGARRGGAVRGTMRLGETSAPFALVRQPAQPSRYVEEPVTIERGGVRLNGALLLPRGRGPHPAIVFQHSGRLETREPWRYWADHFANLGIAGIIWDNRGSDGPRGSRWADFTDVAGDGAAAVGLLRGRRDIDAARIGLFAVSQGGWIAPMVAAADPRIAFVAMVSGPGTSQQRTVLHEARRELEGRKFAIDEVAAGVAAKARFEQMILDGASDDALDAFRASVEGKPWFEHIGLMPRDHWHRDWWRRNAVHDPAKWWPRVQAPVLDLYGELDVELPVIESIAAMEVAYRSAGARQLTTHIFRGADHSLRSRRGLRPVREPDVMRTFDAWILARAGLPPTRPAT